MNFLQRSNNFNFKRKEKKISPFSIGIVFVIIVIFTLPFSRDVLFETISPLWASENMFTSFFKDNTALLESKKSLLAENTALKEQIINTEEDVRLNSIVRKENEDLKNILGRKPTYQKQILAVVLVKPFLSLYDTLVIDVGTHEGVSVGDKVLAEGDSYIGTISDVYSDSAKVTLYSSPGEKTSVLIGKETIEKQALGLGGGNFSTEIPREISVAVGDSIKIPSISSNIFATVEKVVFKEADSFQTILFKSPININHLEWVEVVPAIKK